MASVRAGAEVTGGRSRWWPRRSGPRETAVARPSSAALARRCAPVVVLIALMAAYAAWFSFWSIRKFDAFQAPGFDMGIYDQALWLLSRFKEPFVTILGLNLFGDHGSFIIILLVPLYWIAPYAETLLVVQALALAIGAVPVYLLGRMVLRNAWLSLVPVVAYLLMPALGWLNLENFHPDSFEVPLLLFAFYFMARSRWRPYFVMVALLLIVKEDVPLLLIPLGIYIAVSRDRKVGIVTAAVAAVWLVLEMLVIQPAFSGTGAGELDSWRIPFGGMGGLLATLFKRPWEVAGYMLTTEKVKYLFQLFTPVLFLPLLTWRSLIVAPILVFNLVSTFWYQSSLHYHYTSLLIPSLCALALLALLRFRTLRARRVLAVAMLLATLLSAYLWGPMPGSRDAAYYPDPADPQAVACAEAVASIPADAVVAAGDKFSSHLAHREQIYTFPSPFSATYWGDDSMKGLRLPVADEVEYVLDLPSILPEETLAVLEQLPAEGFERVSFEEGVLLLRRVTPGGSPPE